MEISQLKEILKKIRQVKVAVYGDFCLDAYWFLDPRGGEISAETGLHSQAVKKHYYTLGGASNVIANLAALEPVKIKVIGAIGNDIFGRELVRQFNELGVDHQCLVIQDENFNTTTFSKIILDGKELPRIDFGFFNNRSQKTNDKIISGLFHALKETDALIFNQQVPNSLNNEKFIKDVNAIFDHYNEKILLLDTRHYGHKFKNIYRKTNTVEAARLNGVEANVLDEISFEATEKHAQKLFDESGKPIFITRGSKGILVFDSSGIHNIPGIKLNKTIDPVGAGDTVVSALALCLGAGVKPAEAAEFANLAASVTVQKLFMTGTASGSEMLSLFQELVISKA